MKKEFNHKLIFASTSKTEVISAELTAKYRQAEQLQILQNIFPSNIDLESNIDLVGITLDVATGDLMNRNYQAISNKTLIKIAKNFLWKPVDIEHDRTKCIGVICNYGFRNISMAGLGMTAISDCSVEPLLTQEQAALSDKPVNLCLAVLLWADMVPELLLEKIVDSNDPESKRFASISASWELFTNNYDIAVSSTINLKDATIYRGEDKNQFEKYLVENKGSGKIGDKFVFSVFSDSEEYMTLPAGIGLVKNPAAYVSGLSIVMSENENTEVEQSEENKTTENDKDISKKQCSSEDLNIKIEKKQEIITKIENNCVNTHIETVMPKINKIQDLNDENIKLVSASDVFSLYEQAVSEANAKYQDEQNKVKALEDAEAKLKTDLESFKEKYASLEAEIATIKADQAAKVKQDIYNSRMDDFANSFEVKQEAMSVIASDISALDVSEEAYNAYKNKMKTLLSPKKASVEVKEEVKVETKEEEKKELKKVIASAEIEGAIIPNSQEQENKESLVSKYKKTFNVETLTKK